MTPSRSRLAEVRDFLIHLRPHYQLLVLPGGYLLGGLYAQSIDFQRFLVQFVVVHLLLNGGVTAYNSYFDDDDGPIGGLARPPKMVRWMLPASLAVQILGLVGAAWTEGPLFLGLYLGTMGLSVLYSTNGIRWKGRPLLSFLAVGIGTGTNTYWMGYLAASGDTSLPPPVLAGGLGTACLLLSLYPVSQVFQLDEDQRRGDRTFAGTYGLAGVRRLYALAYPLGLFGVVASLAVRRPEVAGVFLGLGAVGGLYNGWTLFRLQGRPDEYRTVMRLKYLASLGFVAFLVAAMVRIALGSVP
ncbi:MAG: UbiA prenyltransferase family protein [Deltaproteobacteria bacterium]|nr:UbiA prenyltransferase family protein [Deltaproteobacteria bacterium]